MSDAGYDGWELRESGPSGGDRTVLLLAGAMCPAAFYDDLMAEPALTGLRMWPRPCRDSPAPGPRPT